MSTLPVRQTSDWDTAGIEAFLTASLIPLRLAVTGPAGVPLVCSLWFAYEQGRLYCATRPDAQVARCLAARPGCGFEVAVNEMPYHGVRGQAQARLDAAQGGPWLGRLLDRYLGSRDSSLARWLLSRADDEVAIVLEPDWITAWDYRRRMR
jgi:hypothetical protein